MELQASNGTTLPARTSVNLNIGSQQVALSFPGQSIADLLGVNGPYERVNALLIYRNGDDESVADSKADAGPTGSYTLSAFDKGPLYFTGQNSATGINVNGIPGFEILRVQAGISNQAGPCHWFASLSNPAGVEIDFVDGSKSFVAGLNTITLDFNGNKIARSGANGPYTVTGAHLTCNSDETVSVSLFQTQPFQVTQFENVAADFSLPASPVSVAISPGGSATFRFNLNTIAGFEDQVNLQVAGIPATATGTLDMPSLLGSGASILTVETTSNTPSGVYTPNVTGVSAALSHTTPVTLVVETVSAPAAATGPATGVSGTLYQFTASGGASSVGHPIQYSIYFGDDTLPAWSPQGVTTSFHTWSTSGTYIVTVSARCANHPNIASIASAWLEVTIGGEAVATPATPTGPGAGITGTSYAYSTGSSTSSLGHGVQYKLFWGDGTFSPWLPVGTAAASHGWPGPGAYAVTAQARCATHTAVTSPVSTGTTVIVTANETISTPAAAGGPVSGISGISYTYSSGGATSSLGHSVQHQFDWGDGTYSGWLAAGTSSAAHTWTVSGSYKVTIRARCATDWLMLSNPASVLTVNVQ